MVLNLEHGEVALLTGAEVDIQVLGRIFDSVVDEVVDGVGDVEFIGVQHAFDGVEVEVEGAVASDG